jgi:hypothetical protein
MTSEQTETPALSGIHDVTEARYLDRTGWRSGEWNGEPDRIEWRDARAVPVLPCLIVRGPRGALCGYVGVPEGHPWHGRDMAALWGEDGPDVHGGVTYAEPCQAGGRICHVPLPGESDRVWWVGFDCGHAWDEMPAETDPFWRSPDQSYRDVRYVRREVERLADQAREAVGRG